MSGSANHTGQTIDQDCITFDVPGRFNEAGIIYGFVCLILAGVFRNCFAPSDPVVEFRGLWHEENLVLVLLTFIPFTVAAWHYLFFSTRSVLFRVLFVSIPFLFIWLVLGWLNPFWQEYSIAEPLLVIPVAALTLVMAISCWSTGRVVMNRKEAVHRLVRELPRPEQTFWFRFGRPILLLSFSLLVIAWLVYSGIRMSDGENSRTVQRHFAIWGIVGIYMLVFVGPGTLIGAKFRNRWLALAVSLLLVLLPVLSPHLTLLSEKARSEITGFNLHFMQLITLSTAAATVGYFVLLTLRNELPVSEYQMIAAAEEQEKPTTGDTPATRTEPVGWRDLRWIVPVMLGLMITTWTASRIYPAGYYSLYLFGDNLQLEEEQWSELNTLTADLQSLKNRVKKPGVSLDIGQRNDIELHYYQAATEDRMWPDLYQRVKLIEPPLMILDPEKVCRITPDTAMQLPDLVGHRDAKIEVERVTFGKDNFLPTNPEAKFTFLQCRFTKEAFRTRASFPIAMPAVVQLVNCQFDDGVLERFPIVQSLQLTFDNIDDIRQNKQALVRLLYSGAELYPHYNRDQSPDSEINTLFGPNVTRRHQPWVTLNSTSTMPLSIDFSDQAKLIANLPADLSSRYFITNAQSRLTGFYADKISNEDLEKVLKEHPIEYLGLTGDHALFLVRQAKSDSVLRSALERIKALSLNDVDDFDALLGCFSNVQALSYQYGPYDFEIPEQSSIRRVRSFSELALPRGGSRLEVQLIPRDDVSPPKFSRGNLIQVGTYDFSLEALVEFAELSPDELVGTEH